MTDEESMELSSYIILSSLRRQYHQCYAIGTLHVIAAIVLLGLAFFGYAGDGYAAYIAILAGPFLAYRSKSFFKLGFVTGLVYLAVSK